MFKNIFSKLATRHAQAFHLDVPAPLGEVVLRILNLQPWYFRIPLKILALVFPSFPLLATFVQSIVLLRAFDDPELSEQFPHYGI